MDSSLQKHPKSIPKAIDKVEDLIDIKITDGKEENSIKALTFGYAQADGKYRVILFFDPDVAPGVIAHEAKHAVNMIFKWHGVRLSLDNDEHECYYLEQMVDEIHKVLAKFLLSSK